MSGADRTFEGPELPWKPSALEFDGVMTEVLPLRANPYILEKSCDRYVNHAGKIARFRPAMPFVFMAALHYPKTSEAAASLGWVSQNEVVFSVPVEWQQSGGAWGRHWASVSPFLFVDSERWTMSVRKSASGRR